MRSVAGRRGRRPARKKFMQPIFLRAKGAVSNAKFRAIETAPFLLIVVCQTDALACPLFAHCGMVPQVDKGENENCNKEDPLWRH